MMRPKGLGESGVLRIAGGDTKRTDAATALEEALR